MSPPSYICEDDKAVSLVAHCAGPPRSQAVARRITIGPLFKSRTSGGVTSMAAGNLRDQIARLEADIEELADSLDRCRKAMLLSKIAIAGGGICMMAYLLGPIRFDPAIMIGAIAGIVGGVVLFGSNSSTWKQTMAAMKDAESQRAKLIDRIDFGAADSSRGGY